MWTQARYLKKLRVCEIVHFLLFKTSEHHPLRTPNVPDELPPPSNP